MQHSNGGDGSPVIDEGELDDHDTLHTPEDYNDEDAAFHSTHDEQGHLIDENGTHPPLPWKAVGCGNLHIVICFVVSGNCNSRTARACAHALTFC